MYSVGNCHIICISLQVETDSHIIQAAVCLSVCVSVCVSFHVKTCAFYFYLFNCYYTRT